MATAGEWYHKAKEALETLKVINNWDDQCYDYLTRVQELKEKFNAKFDAELEKPEAPVCLQPEDYKPAAKGGKAKMEKAPRKKKIIPPWKDYTTVKAKDIMDVVENHAGQLPGVGTWVNDRTSPNADASAGKAAKRFKLKEGGDYIIRVIEESAGKKYTVKIAPSNYRELHEEKEAAAAAAEDTEDDPVAPVAAPVAAPGAASSSRPQAPAPATQASSPGSTRASRSRTAGEAAAAVPAASDAPGPAPPAAGNRPARRLRGAKAA